MGKVLLTRLDRCEDDLLGCCRFVVEEQWSFDRWKFFDDSFDTIFLIVADLSVVRQ